ncbi:Sbal_3080 family lipoprotein [Teredinibacter sp. KSP-S5-2]|uniref:Sbal_3080 family lipoprotein n=1 Tax=Teredinibacter sp. KSP-S5-2 TaxID=3034506 RepID=UPI002934939D|nr:Sbal_3080 family lipoprotein [Teredinibacter sp. KSP-S5-2]WNO10601.1 Sbal_3080 family lipoprotein [Teredinibacter sp. KSP-S5-2]
MMKKISLFVALLLGGCTAIEIKQVESSHNMDHVCIEYNAKVTIDEFVRIVEDIFQDHGITTEVYKGLTPENCNFKLTYTALRSWDLTPYLSHAELRLFKGNERIGYAEYHLKGKGGLALNKWASVKTKMTPVVNRLLAQY